MSLRWRLARLVAPVPIMAEPFDGDDGAFVIVRQDNSVALFRADRFRLKSRHRLDQYDFGKGAVPGYPRARHFTRFVGTIGGEVLGTGTPVPEARDLPSGDARIEALGVDYDYLP